MKSLLLLLGVHAAVICANAQSLTTTLIVPPGSVAQGAPVRVDVVTFNGGAAADTALAPATLPATLVVGARSWPVELKADGETRTAVAPGGFVSRSYQVVLPAEAAGRGVIEASAGGLARGAAVIDIAGTPADPADQPLLGRAAEVAAQKADTSLDTENAVLGRSFAGRMGAHEPVYFVYGHEGQAAKFQFSFKYKLATFGEKTPESTPSTLQFGYTQRSLWDIEGESSPFYDTSYMPEVFWEWVKIPAADDPRFLHWGGFQTGFKHESNGRDGLDSRSLNVLRLRTYFMVGHVDGWRLVLMPEAWAYIGSLSDNTDIDQYRGNDALRGVFGKADGPNLAFAGMSGEDFDHGSFQLDLTVPMHTRFLDMSVFFLVQYFNGYGESLRSYNEKSESLRAGFSLIR